MTKRINTSQNELTKPIYALIGLECVHIEDEKEGIIVGYTEADLVVDWIYPSKIESDIVSQDQLNIYSDD